MDISVALAEISSYKGFFALTVGGDAAGWHPVRQSYADGCADLVEATARRYRTTDLRIGASLVHLGHATRLWSPVLACALAHGVVPDLKDLQRADGGAQLRMPEPVGHAVDPPSAKLLYRVVVKQHMKPFAAGLRVKLAPALLAGNIASALVGASRALLSARPDLRRPIVEITNSLLDTGMLAGSGVVTGPHLGFRRRSCCLFYRVPGRAVCHDCVFRRTPRRTPRSNRR
ncbi:(2Fe-2S)-binding protein [Mycobacterium sp. 663a-19]|uniref:(2Fe-2S)-binding protein n=1 Tax=Mycobacterium sp. 663a-19 TaxID=2986148 RepID=UPI002D1E6B44|nr:(2Fe-2S)-binding protein [Mycobacterium sp. 663a-19]MEB3983260.1 (2Fe-2S)-binding protein [Mycobacterium sp. 663a-19]